MKKVLAVLVLFSLSAAAALAQDSQVRTLQRFFLMGQGGGEMGLMAQAGAPGQMADVTYKFISSEMNLDARVVKGQPYSAEASTEITQVLADGNRITNKNTASLYRDSQGRTRREETLGMIGPWTASGDAPQTIFINDPVAGSSYILNPSDHTAHKMPLPSTAVRLPILKNGPLPDMGMAITAGGPNGPGGQVFLQSNIQGAQAFQPQTESLGTQTVAGVNAEGTRTTVTIPAGQIGNEQPISIVSERWYSPELQIVVMSKHIDPRMGTTTYQLSNLNRSEPAPSLFQVPPDYTVQDSPGPVRILKAPKQ